MQVRFSLTVMRRKALYSRNVSCSASSAGWRLLKTSVTRRVAADDPCRLRTDVLLPLLIGGCRTDRLRIQSYDGLRNYISLGLADMLISEVRVDNVY